MTGVAIIDFEASCLPDDGMSYPVEVALAVVGGTAREWLIRPAPVWRYWDWSEDAEKLHGVTHDLLDRKGLPVGQVVRELREAAEGCIVYTDSDLDAYWMDTLAQAAGTVAPFGVRYLGEMFQMMGASRAEVEQAESRARARLPREHVACHDARRLALTVELLASHSRIARFAKTGALASAALLCGVAIGRMRDGRDRPQEA